MNSADSLYPPDLGCPFLRGCAETFQAGSDRFEQLVSGAPSERLRQKPAPRAWSAVECMEHLNITGRSYEPLMKDALARGRSERWLGGVPYGKGTWLGRVLIGFLRKPGKLKAPGGFQPASLSKLDSAAVVDEFRRTQRVLADLLTDADGLDLGRIRHPSPVVPLFRLTAAQAFEVLSIHQLRHVGQIEAALALEGS